MPLKIGDTIYHFDSNRRKYPPRGPASPYQSQGPIYREHWHGVTITGETRVSWLTVYGKCPKRGARGWAFTKTDVDVDVWDHEHRADIARRVESRASVTSGMLLMIAETIGYPG